MSKRMETTIDALEARRMMAVDAFKGQVWEIYGTRRDDHIVVEVDAKHPNYLIARNGDTVLGRAVASVVRKIRVFGGEGNDQIFIKAERHYFQNADNDSVPLKPYTVSIDAGDGDDQILSASIGYSGYGGAGNDTLYGTASGDYLSGGAGDDLLSGSYGRDYLDGGEGHDRILGGEDHDTVYGGAGNDLLDGGEGRDLLEGGSGRDQLAGNGERDTLVGGKGADLLTREQRQDTIDPAANDTVQVQSIISDWQKNPAAYAKQLYTNASTSSSGSYLTIGGTRAVVAWDMVSRLATSGSVVAFNSQTNTQVAGLDEADIVENDGSYLYSVSGENLVITDIRNPVDLKVVSTTAMDGSIAGLYLDGGKLTVVYRRSPELQNAGRVGGDGLIFTTGLYRYWNAVSSETVVATFDVSNAAAPAKLGETAIDGNYVSSRYANGRVYVVTNQWTGTPTVEGTTVEGFWIPESEASFSARVSSEATKNAPDYSATRGRRVVQGSLADVGRVVAVGGSVYSGDSQISVSIINTAAPGSAPLSSLVMDNTWAQTTYMSGNNIYITQTDTSGGTLISKVSVAGDQVVFEGRGVVAGYIRDQFSLHETANGDLAVTYSANADVTTSLAVLKDTGDTLSKVDSIDGIAPGERLFATRFVGDRVYFVTYEQVDPLFVADISNPSDLKLLGELKIPGFSQYLHPIDETHLIGVGQRDDDEDGRSEGVQVSLFDVSDPAKPKKVDTQNLTVAGWSYSAAQSDHLAFTYEPESGLIALPLSAENGTSIEVLKVDTDTGLDSVLSISSNTERGVFANGAAFAVGVSSIKSALLNDPSKTDEVSLEYSGGVTVE